MRVCGARPRPAVPTRITPTAWVRRAPACAPWPTLPVARKIPRHLAARDLHLARGRRRVAAAADEARLAAGDHGADRGDVAIADGGERAVLSAALGRVDEHDVGGLARHEQPGVEAVDARIAPRRGRDAALRRNAAEA